MEFFVNRFYTILFLGEGHNFFASVKGGPVLFKPFVGEVHYFLAELCLNIVALPPIKIDWALRFDALGVEDIFKSRPQTGYWHLFGVLSKIPDEHHRRVASHVDVLRLVERVTSLRMSAWEATVTRMV